MVKVLVGIKEGNAMESTLENEASFAHELDRKITSPTPDKEVKANGHQDSVVILATGNSTFFHAAQAEHPAL